VGSLSRGVGHAMNLVTIKSPMNWRVPRQVMRLATVTTRLVRSRRTLTTTDGVGWPKATRLGLSPA
jgi:hypothetical protein